MKTNRICKICGKAYYYCASCDESAAGKTGYEPWHILVHDENCYKIFTILQKHFLKEYSNEYAKRLLKQCDLSVLETAPENIKKQANNILNTRKPRAKKVIEEIN